MGQKLARCDISENTRHKPNAGSVYCVNGLQRWPSIEPALGDGLAFTRIVCGPSCGAWKGLSGICMVFIEL